VFVQSELKYNRPDHIFQEFRQPLGDDINSLILFRDESVFLQDGMGGHLGTADENQNCQPC